jgi:multisubunit Na+/H+ antiporter MnhG subunit
LVSALIVVIFALISIALWNFGSLQFLRLPDFLIRWIVTS